MTEYPFVTAGLNFLPAGIEAPAAVYDGTDSEPVRNFEQEHREVNIANGRLTFDQYALDTNGFEFVQAPTALGVVESDDDASIAEIYYPEVVQILKQATGAKDVVIFDHTIRITGNQDGRRPVQSVHNDYTEGSAPKRVAQLLGAEEAEKRFAEGRVTQVNLWRPLQDTPVTALPLAFVDAQTVDPADLRRTDLIYPDRDGEIYQLQAAPKQRWTYFPDMTRDEAVLIKGYDSDREAAARFTPHTAFDLPGDNEGRRHSIEVRAFLFH